MADSGDFPSSFDETALPVAEVNDQHTGPGLLVETVLVFRISWVREALTAVGITVDELSNKGKYRAAPIKNYETLSNSVS